MGQKGSIVKKQQNTNQQIESTNQQIETDEICICHDKNLQKKVNCMNYPECDMEWIVHVTSYMEKIQLCPIHYLMVPTDGCRGYICDKCKDKGYFIVYRGFPRMPEIIRRTDMKKHNPGDCMCKGNYEKQVECINKKCGSKSHQLLSKLDNKSYCGVYNHYIDYYSGNNYLCKSCKGKGYSISYIHNSHYFPILKEPK